VQQRIEPLNTLSIYTPLSAIPKNVVNLGIWCGIWADNGDEKNLPISSCLSHSVVFIKQLEIRSVKRDICLIAK